ncbi:L-aspartate oxidase [Thermoproteus tenax]|uniref:L-aspartate oxidase n=1 Tax=Thermoproteus tenax (strain ATCC 35583 / DSM 2078 / JCM 9277 / NBRC 100435 / Kra 1) TaxID=768679 RepID=G4RN25_THETK|nr:FAD-dependent oxidoreductase [Thermoproteus tenax]CCC80969.1 Aspartate oxidase [Thermoproteus tenax Kra 1]
MREVVVAGSGVAGLALAVAVAERRVGDVVLVTRDPRGGSSWKAQGGIAAPLDDEDVEAHVRDTIAAGRGLNDEEVVRLYVGMGRRVISWLTEMGFKPSATRALEGGHSRARVVKAEEGGDKIGEAVMRALSHRAEELGIQIVRGSLGEVLVKDGRAAGVVLSTGETLRADAVAIATGGYAGLYKYSTTDADGSGIYAAMRAGALARDLEFVQFHPTAALVDGEIFLISEAVRGEGALLYNGDGERFMPKYDPAAELAPRDVVSRAVYAELERTGRVTLDASAVEGFERKFPAIAEFLKRHGVSPSSIPVVPAAHYAIGGIVADPYGRTHVRGLFAVGEASSTLFHGANRLASNSLLEALAQALLAAEALRAYWGGSWEAPRAGGLLYPEKCPYYEGDVRETMWRLVGIVREGSGLRRAVESLEGLPKLIAEAAWLRSESIGVHYRADYPAWSGVKYHILFRCL